MRGVGALLVLALSFGCGGTSTEDPEPGAAGGNGTDTGGAGGDGTDTGDAGSGGVVTGGAAAGGSAGGDAGPGGAEGSGGVGGDPGDPVPRPRAASRVAPLTSGCGVGPYLIPAGGEPTTDTVVGTRVEDGVDGASVSCTVSVLDGDGYQIRVSVAQGSSFGLFGTVHADASGVYSGDGEVTFYAPAADQVSSASCVLVIGVHQEIGPGMVWGSFTCTDSRIGSSAGASCDFGGSFLAESCGT